MRKIQKGISFILALVLVFSTMVTVFAYERDELILWEDLPDGKIVFSNSYSEYQTDIGKIIYVVDKNSTMELLFNAYSIYIYDENEFYETNEWRDVTDEVTEKINFNTISYMDDIIMPGEMKETEVIQAGAKLKFIKPGQYSISVTYGYASREERLEIQKNDETYSWQVTRTIFVWVADTNGETEENYTENYDNYNETQDLIKYSEWARPEIENADAAGLITPSLGEVYTKDITRGQFAELIVNMVEKVTQKEIEAAPDTTFIDTSDISVLKAYASNIVNGVDENIFEPDTLITREQIATMLYRAINYIENETGNEYVTKNDNLDNYTDKDMVSSWALSAVGVLANNEIMKGTSETTLSPQNNASIEQCIVLVYRLFEKLI